MILLYIMIYIYIMNMTHVYKCIVSKHMQVLEVGRSSTQKKTSTIPETEISTSNLSNTFQQLRQHLFRSFANICSKCLYTIWHLFAFFSDAAFQLAAQLLHSISRRSSEAFLGKALGRTVDFPGQDDLCQQKIGLKIWSILKHHE